MSKTLLESWEKEYPSIDFKEFLKERQAAHDKDMGIQIKLAYGEGILEGEERMKKVHEKELKDAYMHGQDDKFAETIGAGHYIKKSEHDKEIEILSVALDNAPDAIDKENKHG